MAVTGGAFNDRYLELNGLNLHFLEWGSPAASTVLLLHGYGNCAATWTALAESLSDRYHLLAPDFRGHGDSQWDDAGHYGLRYHVADITALIDILGINELAIIGHSMGGQVALAYAAACPSKVSRVICVDIGPELSPRSEARLKQTSSLRRDVYDSLDEVTDYLEIVDPYASHELLRGEAADLTRKNSDGRFVWKHHYRLAKRASPGKRLNAAGRWETVSYVKCPTLIIRGERSDLLDAEVARKMTGVMNQAELVEITDAGHYVHRDQPLLFAEAVRRFLEPAE
jgi:pimeloyl-ACP methyl ester carboxylesterase